MEQGTAWSLRQWHKHIQWAGNRWGSDSVCDFQSSRIEDIFRHASNMTTIKYMIITMHKWSDEALSVSADFWQVLVAFLSGTNNCCCPGLGHVHSPAWPDGDIWVQAASFSFDCFGSSQCQHNFCFHCVTATKTVSYTVLSRGSAMFISTTPFLQRFSPLPINLIWPASAHVPLFSVSELFEEHDALEQGRQKRTQESEPWMTSAKFNQR